MLSKIESSHTSIFKKKKYSKFSLNNIPNNILRKFNKVNVKLSSLTTLILDENDHYFITHKSWNLYLFSTRKNKLNKYEINIQFY